MLSLGSCVERATALSAAVLQGEAAAVPDAEHGLGRADPAGHPRGHLRLRVSGRPVPWQRHLSPGGCYSAGWGARSVCRWCGTWTCHRLPNAGPWPRWAPGQMGLPCHRPPGPSISPSTGAGRALWAAATQSDTVAPRPHRYVGELISDSEADVREEDSYLFDLDNKVMCPRGRASAQS